MEIEDEESFDLTGRIVIRGRAPEFIGSYSLVYRGKWGESMVAVKVIRSVGALSTMRRKVRRERMVWEALEHPNILPFYGHAEDEEFQPFGAFISPWCSNGDIGRFLEQYGGDMEAAERAELWKGVLSGVAFLHSRNPVIVHGDLKPGNILIDDNRDPRICDFGLSRIIQEGGTGGMTTTTEHTGTERYLAPELVTANISIPTKESDVYALGCLGLEIIYLQRPYVHRQNNHHGCIIVDIREGLPPANRQDNIHSPKDVRWGCVFSWYLLEALWSPDPMGRPAAAFVVGCLAPSNDVPDNAHIMRGVPMQHSGTHLERRDQERHMIDQSGTGDLMRKRKICVLGSRAAGKSSLIIKFAGDTFVEPYYPTIERPYFKQFPFNGVEYDVSIIDTASQGEYSLLSAKHAIGIHGYILVYSVINRQSFDMVLIVYEKLRNFQDISHLPAVVVGQKPDLVDTDESLREVPAEEAAQLVKERGLAWVEISETNKNVNVVFEMCLKEIEKAMHPEAAATAPNGIAIYDKDKCIVM